MTLDLKALTAAARAHIDADPSIEGHHIAHIHIVMPQVEATVRAYLAAAPAPAVTDEMADLALDIWLGDGGRWRKAFHADDWRRDMRAAITEALGRNT